MSFSSCLKARRVDPHDPVVSHETTAPFKSDAFNSGLEESLVVSLWMAWRTNRLGARVQPWGLSWNNLLEEKSLNPKIVDRQEVTRRKYRNSMLNCSTNGRPTESAIHGAKSFFLSNRKQPNYSKAPSKLRLHSILVVCHIICKWCGREWFMRWIEMRDEVLISCARTYVHS